MTLRSSSTTSSENARAHATSEVPILDATITVEEAITRTLAGRWAQADQVWVVGPDDRFVGVLTLVDLVRADSSRPILDLCESRPPSVAPDTDQEHVALHAMRHRQSAVPVVDEAGRLVGVVLAASLLRILRHEHVEDLHRLAGIARESPAALDSFDDPPVRRAWHRLPWLMVGLVGSALATWVMSSYEGTLEQHVAIGFFVPGIVYLADAIGTQSETFAVRGLSNTRIPLYRLIIGEAWTGVVIGAVLATLALIGVWLGFASPRLALSVALAIFASGALATTIGIMLPWLLSRLGQDPALGSGPLATIIQDCLSIFVYFTIAIHLGA